MKTPILAAVLSTLVAGAATAQARPAAEARGERGQADKPPPLAQVAEAYAQFLRAHRLEQSNDLSGAIAAYQRAMELDPSSADVPAELAALYLRQDRVQEAIATAELALKIAPANREANRVLGVVYAASAENGSAARGDENREANLAKAIKHFEIVLDRPAGETDPNVRATLSRLYLRAKSYEKAIQLLTDLVNHEQGWQDGPVLLAQAFAAAGRPKEAILWLEQKAPDDPRLLPTLADFYERERRWKDAARTYEAAVQRAPRNIELKTRYASALLNAGGADDLETARTALGEIVQTRSDPRTLYMLSQAERRTGNFSAAEATARRMIAAQNGRSAFGYYALAEVLSERREYKAVVDELTPALAAIRGQTGDHQNDLGMLLPHLGFAHQVLGAHDQAIAAFDEAHRLAPNDAGIAGYLIEAHIAAKHYGPAIDLAKQELVAHPGNLRLARLEAQALRLNGKADLGVAVLEDILKQHADEPAAYVALAQVYADASLGPQAVKLLRDAEARFPSDSSILFELGAVFDKQKKFADAEAAFRQVLAREPENAAVLNYLGYMLADRGERLDESVAYLKRAVQKEPYNGSYLDSLGWAYYKANKLDLAEINLRRAADQLRGNSVVQDHFGDLLFKLGRYDDAVAFWTRALEGDGDTIVRADIDKKIRAARQKLGKK